MKAKDWAAKLAETPDNLGETLKAFVEEIGTIAKQRGGSLAATEGAVREQRAKWQAICRDSPALDAGQFESLLETYGPEFKKAEETVKAQAARKGRPGMEGTEGPMAGRRLGSRGKKGGGARSP